MRGWTVERWIGVATLVCSVIGFTFGLGVNWARITQQEAQIKAFEQTYLRADVYAADQRRISESLDRLSEELKQWREQPPTTVRVPTPTRSRMFDK